MDDEKKAESVSWSETGPFHSDESADFKQSQASGLPEILRILRIQTVDQVRARTSPVEHPKVALHQSRRIAFYHILLHILPVAGAIILLGLNLTRYHVGPAFAYSTALQFLAKLHEILIQASIGEVLLCVIRTQAVKQFIPLGALSAALKSHQLSYLWSLEFISAVRSRAFSHWAKMTFITSIPLLILLMAVVGPSSAALMIPRPNSQSTIGSVTEYGELNQALTPERVNGSYKFRLDFDRFSNGFVPGSERILSWPASQTITNTDDYAVQRTFRYTTSRRSGTKEEDWYYSTIATMPTRESVRNLRYVRSFFPGYSNFTVSAQFPHPVVVTRCTQLYSGLGLENQTLPYIQDNGIVAPLSSFKDLIEAHAGSSYPKDANITSLPPVWMPSPETGSSSLLGIITKFETTLPDEIEGCKASNLSSEACSFQVPHLKVRACTVSAHWTWSENELLFNEGTSTARITSLPNLGFEKPQQDSPIKMDFSEIPFFNSPNMTDVFPCLQCGDPVEPALAYMFATTLAEVPTLFEFDIYGKIIDEKLTTPYKFVAKEYGFGYDISSASIQLALAVMIAYCALVFGYLTYIFVTGSTSTAWNSTVEFVMIALQSKSPDHLGHTSVGINSLRTYEEPVGIRVDGKSEKLELVFAHDRDIGTRDLRKIEPNRAY